MADNPKNYLKTTLGEPRPALSLKTHTHTQACAHAYTQTDISDSNHDSKKILTT